jgi:4-hydroxybenzoate polyprenyltransferase
MTSAAPTPGRCARGQTFAGGSRLATYASFVKLPHTVFALPFALVGVIIASYRHAVTWAMLGWVVLAFTAARFAAMGFNRIVDREYDARNPRTQMRELPRGAMTVREAWLSVAAASVVFVAAAGALNRLCLLLSPIALGWVFFYSFTKRFTRFAHVALGVGMSIAPVGGYLAVMGRWSEPWWLLCTLATAVVTWGRGSTCCTRCPDIAFDRRTACTPSPPRSASAGDRRVARTARGDAAVARARGRRRVSG